MGAACNNRKSLVWDKHECKIHLQYIENIDSILIHSWTNNGVKQLPVLIHKAYFVFLRESYKSWNIFINPGEKKRRKYFEGKIVRAMKSGTLLMTQRERKIRNISSEFAVSKKGERRRKRDKFATTRRLPAAVRSQPSFYLLFL